MLSDSQTFRKISSETDSLHYAFGWEKEDLDRPQIMIAGTYGESHPGSSHLLALMQQAEKGVYQAGGTPGKYFATDICDGVCQGTTGMQYSLLSRDFIAAMVEIQARARPVDGLVLVSSCDKAIPSHLLAAARLDVPTVFVPGGVMQTAPSNWSCDQMWEYDRQCDAGCLSKEELCSCKQAASPSDGACQGMGTASTMQVLTEALGLAIPGTALITATSAEIRRRAKTAGRLAVEIAKSGLTVGKVVSDASIKNAIVVHSAICGSANAVMHLSAFARELGREISLELFNDIHAEVPVLADVMPSGRYSAEQFWYAGGTMKVMSYLKRYLDLTAMTVTGRTLGEELDRFEHAQEPKNRAIYLADRGLKTEDVIHTPEEPFYAEGGMAVLKGNLCPGGALIKHAAVLPDMHVHTGPVRIFETEDEAIDALLHGGIWPGCFIIIRYQGPKACGMPEMFRMSDALAKKPELAGTTALITDGRYSGYTKGPSIGYVTPEAYSGGPIGLLREGDILHLDIPRRQLDIVGFKGEQKTAAEVTAELDSRAVEFQPKEIQVPQGALSIYRKLIGNVLQGDRIL